MGDETLGVLNLPGAHTLDADGLSTQLAGYLFRNSQTTVVHDDNRFMFHIHKNLFAPHALTSRAVWHVTDEGWSSDFPPLPSAFSDNSLMAFMLRSHNGVHCCGTVGDSHSHSQLSAVKHTFTGTLFRIQRQGRCKPRAIKLA